VPSKENCKQNKFLKYLPCVADHKNSPDSFKEIFLNLIGNA
jgi:hypothetical protein